MRLESRRALKYDATGIPSDLYHEHGSDVLYCYGMICRGYAGPNHSRSKLPIHSYSLSPLQSCSSGPAAGLLEFLLARVQDGYSFPMNPDF